MKTITPIVVALLACAGQAFAVSNVVIGDSLSSPAQGAGVIPWATIAFADDVANLAVGGWTTYQYLNECDAEPATCWAHTGDSTTVWWLLIGHNDFPLATALGGTPAGYAERLVDLADRIEAATGATDIRLLTSPYANPAWVSNWPDAWIDEMAQLDVLVCGSDERFTCVSDLREVLDLSDLRDGVHFNQSGHDKVAAVVVPEPSAAQMAAVGMIVLGLLARRRAR